MIKFKFNDVLYLLIFALHNLFWIKQFNKINNNFQID
jgi:hypothetical protein